MQDAFFCQIDDGDRGLVPEAHEEPLARSIDDAGVGIAFLVEADCDSLVWIRQRHHTNRVPPGAGDEQGFAFWVDGQAAGDEFRGFPRDGEGLVSRQ